MLEIIRYNPSYREEWDRFVRVSRNGTFLFERAYMDYHSDRFTDMSFLFYFKGKLQAVMPGNINGDTYYSHQGLTYGGIILDNKITSVKVLQVFDQLKRLLKELDVKKWIYKPVPHIYHTSPSEEDIYALFRLGAKQTGCGISSTVKNDRPIRFSELRRKGIRKAVKAGVVLSEQPCIDSFWGILSCNLIYKYATHPVHLVEEMRLLINFFPDNIYLHTVELAGEVLAGVVVYLSEKVAHVQYISASEKGKELGALDYLFHHLISERYKHIDYFDFGVSTENMGEYLNESLIFQKEGFGGRGIVYSVFELEL
ncbi:MAG: GNAT family N-acetyltransferase [Bacteroidales bacterium]